MQAAPALPNFSLLRADFSEFKPKSSIQEELEEKGGRGAALEIVAVLVHPMSSTAQSLPGAARTKIPTKPFLLCLQDFLEAVKEVFIKPCEFHTQLGTITHLCPCEELGKSKGTGGL